MSRVKRSFAVTGIGVLLFAAAFWILFNRQLIQDWLTVVQFQPSSGIATIAADVKMSKQGKFIFYASEPTRSEAQLFNTQCERREASTAILGCYANGRIYLFEITNSELSGIEEVTAAHEMLHAGWERMSAAEQEEVGELLESAYQRVKTPELEERMAYYDRQQPGERVNELHSILGTETADLGDALEKHYARYFLDRQLIVKLHDGYQKVFTELQDQATALQQETTNLIAALNADVASYNERIEALNQSTLLHNQALQSVNRTSAAEVEAYNSRRAALESQREALATERQRLEARQAEYEQKVKEYNALIIRSTTLSDSIDSLKVQTDLSD